MSTTLSQIDKMDPEDLAHEAHLRYITDSIPGFIRSKKGDNFWFYDLKGGRIHDPRVVGRIDNLRIPPAWDRVWISPFSYSHIQATGIDEKGRKQYIYHDKWHEISKQNKFNKMYAFSNILPELRSKIERDMADTQLSQEKILATIVWLLDNTYIRVGNDEYAKDNEHYGLTTMRNKHVDILGSTVTFEFVGKSGKKHKVGVSHPRVAKTIKKLEEIPGYELFQYIDEHGDHRPVDSQDVNDYLKDKAQENVTAKDFRTWGGTVTSAEELVDLGDFENKIELKKKICEAVKNTAQLLGNTMTVCRNYYIHPVILTTYEQKKLIPHFADYRKKGSKVKYFDRDEYAVQKLLEV